MGFTQDLSNTAGSMLGAFGSSDQYKAYRDAAGATEKMAEKNAQLLTTTAMENQRREIRNARMQTAAARADAGAAHLLTEGSAAVREKDLATRLEDEINSRTEAALQEADRIRRQGGYDAWNLRTQAHNAKTRATGATLESLGSALLL